MGRRVLHIIEQLACVIDTRSRGCVYFDQIDKTTFVDRRTRFTLTARLGYHPFRTIQRLCEYARNGGFANTASP